MSLIPQRQTTLQDAVFVRRGANLAGLLVASVIGLAIFAWFGFTIKVLGWDPEHQRLRFYLSGFAVLSAMAPIALWIRARTGDAFRVSISDGKLSIRSLKTKDEQLGAEVHMIEYGHVSDGGPFEARLDVNYGTPNTWLRLRVPDTRITGWAKAMAPLHEQRNIVVVGDRNPDRQE